MQTLDFRVDHVTRQRLGERSLAEVGAHLWPESCATCSRPLGPRPAALSVSATPDVGVASIHHFSCRRPGWEDVQTLPAGRPADHRARALLLESRRGGTAETLPVLLVNPSLSRVELVNGPAEWRVATVENAAALGLRPGADVVVSDDEAGRLVARVSGARVGVRLDDGREWWAPVDGGVLRRIRELDGVLLAVTSAVHPGRVATVADVMPAITAGRVALGWIGLEGYARRARGSVERQPPNDAKPAAVLDTGRG